MLRFALLGLVATWFLALARLALAPRATVPAPARDRSLPRRAA
jgi:hypothetical protein